MKGNLYKFKMSIQHLYTQEHEVSSELTVFLEQIKPNVDAYTASKAEAQKQRMLIIGQIAEYRSLHPQRSADHRLLSQMMNSEWSGDVIKSAVGAYKAYKELKDDVKPEYQKLADEANPTQLLTLGRCEDKTIIYDAAMHLKRTGEVPSASKLRGYKAGHFNNKFEHRVTKLDKAGTTQAVPNPLPQAQPELEQQISIEQKLVDDESMKYINNLSVARAYQCGKTPVIRAALQHVTQTGCMSEELEAGMRVLADEIYSAIGRSQARRQQAAAKTSISNHRTNEP